MPETANAKLLTEMSSVRTQKGRVHSDCPRIELPGRVKNHTYQAFQSASCSVLGLAGHSGSQFCCSKHGASTPSWPPLPGAPHQGRRQSAALWPRRRTGPAGSHCSALLLRRPGRQGGRGEALGEPSPARAPGPWGTRACAEWLRIAVLPGRPLTAVMTSVLEEFGWGHSAR